MKDDRARLYAVAADNAGLVSRRRLLDEGVPRALLDREVREGRLQRVVPSVYRAAGTPMSPALMRRAVLLAAGPGAAISHRSAALAHRWSVGRSEPVEVLVPHGRRCATGSAIVHRTLHLPVDHVVEVGGVAVTTVERTLADLGAVLNPHMVARAVQEAVIARQTSAAELYRFVDRHGGSGRSGIGALRSALDDWVLSAKPPESKLELMFARLVERGGLPLPVLQHEVRSDDGHVIARVDAAWPMQRIAVEVDGHAAHATPSALRRDLDRQNALVLSGWTMLRFTWNDVVRYPAKVVRELRAVLTVIP